MKCLLIFLLLITYVNRGFFVSSPDAEPAHIAGTEHAEVNSLIEFWYKIISGHENDVDEDGNSPESYHFAKVVQPIIDHRFIQSIDLRQPVSFSTNTPFPFNEASFPSPNYGTIDHPPEKA